MKGTKIIFILIVAIFLLNFASITFSATVTSSSGSYTESGTRTVSCDWWVYEDYGDNHIMWRSNCGDWCADMGTSQPSSTTEAYSYTVNYTDYTCTYISGVTAWSECLDHTRNGTSFNYKSFTQRNAYPTCNDSVCISNCYCNSAPTKPVVRIVPNTPPESPKTDQDLRCEITTRSTDADISAAGVKIDSITYKYQWLKNSVIIPGLTRNWISLVSRVPTYLDAGSNTISSSNTFYKDDWTCKVTPKDNQDGVGNAATASATIQNTSPLRPVISSQSERIIKNNQIRLGFNAVDPDVSIAEDYGQFLFYYGRRSDGESGVSIILPTGYDGVSPGVDPTTHYYSCYEMSFDTTSQNYIDCNDSGFNLNSVACNSGIRSGPANDFDTDLSLGKISYKWDSDFLNPTLPKEYCEGHCSDGVCEADDAEVVVEKYCYIKTDVNNGGVYSSVIDPNPTVDCFRDPETNENCVSWNRDVIGTPIEDCNGDCSDGVCLESGTTNVGCYSYNVLDYSLPEPNDYSDCRDELIGGNYFLGEGSKCVSTLFKNTSICNTGDIFPGINLCFTYDIFDINAEKNFCNTSCMGDSCNDDIPTSKRCYVMEFGNSNLLDNCLNSGVCDAPTSGAFNRCDENSANNKLCVTWNLFNPTSNKTPCEDSCFEGSCVSRECFGYDYEPFSDDYNDCRDSGFDVDSPSSCKKIGTVGPRNSTDTDENTGEVAYSWIHESVMSGVEKKYCGNGCENGLCRTGGGFSNEVEIEKVSFANNASKTKKVEKLSFTSLACTGSHINEAPNFTSDFIKATNCVNNLTAPSFVTLTGLNRAENNCFKGILFDGNQFSSESDFSCLPVIDEIRIENSTASSSINGTRWIKNHLDTAADPFGKVTCEFDSHDKDFSDGRIVLPLNYNITLIAKRFGGEERIVESKTGTVFSGTKASEEFDVNNYPGTTHTYEVGTRLYCNVKINDGFFEDDLNSFTGSAWEIQGPLEDATRDPTNYVEVVNTIPYEPRKGILDRGEFSSILETTIGVSDDPDVFVGDGGQSLTYFGRFYEKIDRPDYDDGNNLSLGDFDPADDGDRYFSVALTKERIFSFEGRSFDQMEYSPFVYYDSNETPFQPTCPNLGLDMTIIRVDCDEPSGKTAVSAMVTCNKATEMDEDWTVGINSLTVRDATLTTYVSRLLNVVTDCNTDQQTVYFDFDANSNKNFTVDFDFGGTYNGEELSCSNPEDIIVIDCEDSPNPPGDTGLCHEVGIIPMVVDTNLEDGQTRINFEYICSSNPATITEVILTNPAGGVVGSESVNLDCDSNVKEYEILVAPMDLGAYAIEFKYDYKTDSCSKKLTFGISEASNLNIPDSNIFVILLAILIVSIIIVKPTKKK